MSIHYADDSVTLHHGDCIEVLRTLPDASVDSVVTDPPYGLGFMGKEWDSGKSFVERKAAKRNDFDHVGGNHNPSNAADAARTRRSESAKFGAWCELWAAECLRVLKPGGHLLAFGGTRTWHRLACAVEDAGFEVRDSIAWLYGSGFPKSLDVSKAIDKAAGAERDVVGPNRFAHLNGTANGDVYGAASRPDETAPATADAARWEGWGTALKPAFEPVVVARKPLTGTVAANVLEHGTGALNIDAARIHSPGSEAKAYTVRRLKPGATLNREGGNWRPEDGPTFDGETKAGRWPANVILDETQADTLDEQSGDLNSGLMRAGTKPKGERETYGRDAASGYETQRDTPGDSGGASRFFYVAKADQTERPRVNGTAHPTVKPLTLMRWLVRLVTPPGGTVLEPFAGSGTTVEACIIEHFRCIAIEKGAEYLPLIESRIARRRDPVRAIELAGEDMGLLALLDGEAG